MVQFAPKLRFVLPWRGYLFVIRKRHSTRTKVAQTVARVTSIGHDKLASPSAVNLNHFEIEEAHGAEQKHQERLAKVKKNPRFFFSYVKRHSRLKCNVGILYKGAKLSNNLSELAETLQEQYVFCLFDYS